MCFAPKSGRPFTILISGVGLYMCVCVCFHSRQWKAVLLGQLVCEEREQWSVRMAKSLCQRLLQDTCSALDKVCAHVREFNSVPVLQHIT